MTRSGQGDAIWTRDEIESPCVRICVIHPEAGICIGCNRSRDEIAAWSGMTPADRRAIMADLPARTGLLRQRRGGRAARLCRDRE